MLHARHRTYLLVAGGSKIFGFLKNKPHAGCSFDLREFAPETQSEFLCIGIELNVLVTENGVVQKSGNYFNLVLVLNI